MIKIIFGVYGDAVNAQNINGIEIAKRLDLTKFEPHMFYYDAKPNVPGIVFHKASKKKLRKNISKFLTYFRGNYDIYYMPRVEKVDLFFARMFRKRRCMISSIEIENAVHNERFKEFFCYDIFDFFAINKGLEKNVKDAWDRNVQVLYLGYCNVEASCKVKNGIRKIAFVGSMIKRKNPQCVLEIAKEFPDIEFLMVGDGPEKKVLERRIEIENLTNVKLLGSISNIKVYQVLSQCDLLLITSENEGQPKVSLEAASLGVPTCYINNSYTIDYVENNETGFEAKGISGIKNLITNLNKEPHLLEYVSKNVVDRVRNYNWDELIKDYMDYFEEIHNSWKITK
jgi:glycosyltransferase involved in cell wall biosynthesis